MTTEFEAKSILEKDDKKILGIFGKGSRRLFRTVGLIAAGVAVGGFLLASIA